MAIHEFKQVGKSLTDELDEVKETIDDATKDVRDSMKV
jgi:hypothetical protein